MENIPYEVIALIAEFTPDSRGLLLTCTAYYEILCAMPDVAYWCSGRDLRWLLPKMVPDVWSGYLRGIIAADNVAVFARMHVDVGADLAICLQAAKDYDARQIGVYLRDSCGIGSDNWGAPKAPLPCKKGESCSGFEHDYADRVAALHGVNGFRSWLGPPRTYMHIRTYPLPPPEFHIVLRRSDLGCIKDYLRAYRAKVTIIMVAKMAHSRYSNVLRWLYTEVVREHGCEMPFLLRDVQVWAANSDDVRFFAERGVDILPAAFPNYLPVREGLLETYIERFRDEVAEMVGRGIFNNPQETVETCARMGIMASPGDETLACAFQWSDVLYIIGKNPSVLASPKLLNWARRWVRPDMIGQCMRDLREIAGAKSAIAMCEAIFNCVV